MKKIIGITGGIASGKSKVCNYIKELGYPVIDADAISKELSQKDMPIYNKIIETFGIEYLLPNLEIDRKKLGALIFKDKAKREKLNQITHPIIVEKMQKKIQEIEKNIIFLEIPLLFEAKLSHLCDKIVCVYVTKEVQLERLILRDHISKAYALQKIESQMPLEEKRALSDYVIHSEDDYNQTKNNILEVIRLIKGEKNYG